ncbi:hypothetical protein CHU93_11265 [Sandarakinorhabdus cyanobacteriorum]|uniref:Antitoxin n=1 Tax=Sandarakinorhabdus cyanobacteriorum TaxID=1981098 RepID=A0A255YCX0_9SPHN|nr:type II toxin-antitoxin system prevent-host-death family antitoxin [Sandarakinorhabdus cyanobacteriorum]OYQ27082.1 hypothetical protein CHU93_11265 [Sandarakinorhabdus cyanobacteriorum]
MARYSVVEAKNNLSALIDAAQAGEEVVITRHGKPAARMVPSRAPEEAEPPSMAVVLDELRQLRASVPATGLSRAALIRQLRDEGY